ncbi:DNA gyrase subunit A [Peptococcus simiae]|uniref:DNA gyrase subunit A n=1 Tax=Peptococcus simiae TaxID=1643805 RepID=UPI00397F2721
MENYTHGSIRPIHLVEEMKTSFLDYSMSVITSRALPDVRDGLKPVHRRILFGMHKAGFTPDKPTVKSANIVGYVLGHLHPHGDSACYDAMVRMEQPFAMRYPLVDGQGNFGNIDGYQAAAMRYTEARMSRLAREMLRDIDKETVDYTPNYDNTMEEPVVLPARFPNLLVNGSSGIAVGMATNMPPHNLRNVTDAVLAMIEDPEVSDETLYQKIKGPDFPTGAIIMGTDGIRNAYKTGRGSITVRARTGIEKMSGGKHRIVVTEIPYQVNKARLITKIAELTRDKVLDGITDLRDESDRKGLRIVVELRRDVNPRVMLNQLFKHTQLQENFGVINLALVGGEPKILNLRQMLAYYLDHQENIIIRRIKFDLRKAEERAHIVEGLKIAVDNIDEVIRIIRSSYDDAESKARLGEAFGLSDRQAQAVIEMQLRRLQGLNVTKLEEELAELRERIAYYKSILADINLVRQIIAEELSEITDKYGDDRRTEISFDDQDMDIYDLIADEDMVITLSHDGYIKRMPMDTYKSQKRGGRGVSSAKMKEEDWIEEIFITTTHHQLLFFTNTGRVLRLRAFDIPESSRTGKGMAIINLLNLNEGEKVATVIALRDFDDRYLTAVTKLGKVKKTALKDYDTNRKDGILAIRLDDGDEVVAVKLTAGHDELIIVTERGYAIRFNEEDVRPTGRYTAGVIGIKLGQGDQVINMDIVQEDASLLVITEKGFGKRTKLTEYNLQNRGGKGVFTVKLGKRGQGLVQALVVRDGEEVMTISREGTLIRFAVNDISQTGRATQGVTMMHLEGDDEVVGMARIIEEED